MSQLLHWEKFLMQKKANNLIAEMQSKIAESRKS